MSVRVRIVHLLCYSHIFPNSQERVRGPFILRRNTYLRELMDVTVVAPLPLAPPIPWVPRWQKLARVPAFEQIEQLPVYHPRYLKFPGTAFHRQHKAMLASALRSIKAIHARHPIDLIEAPWLYPDGLVAVEVGKRLGIPVVTTALGSDINEYKDDAELLPLIVEVMSRAAKVVCVSQALTREGQRLGVAANKFAVIYNGVDGERFQPGNKAELRAQLGLPAERKVVVFVGHHEYIKGMDTLLEAWPLVNASNAKPPLLVMIGSGPMRAQLIRQMEPMGVHFVAEQPHEYIGRWIAAADALLLPSYAEGVPNVLLEANASGVPIICTNVGGISEIMDGLQADGSAANGHMVAAHDAEALARAVERVLACEYSVQGLRSNALRFNWEACARQYQQLFQTVVDEQRPSVTRGAG